MVSQGSTLTSPDQRQGLFGSVDFGSDRSYKRLSTTAYSDLEIAEESQKEGIYEVTQVPKRQWRRRCALGIFILAIVGLISFNISSRVPRPKRGFTGDLVVLPHALAGIHPSPSSATNATMGFGKIHAINLETRTDKRDELILMGKATGLDINFYHPIPMDDLDEKGLPPHGVWKEGKAASVTRAHMSVYEKILSEPYDTALILEDDIDWEVDWKTASSRLTHALSTLLTSHNNDSIIREATEEDPWSHKSWDLLFFGSCFEGVHRDNLPPGVSVEHLPGVHYLDPTTPDQDHWLDMSKKIFREFDFPVATKEQPVDQRRRAVIRSAGPICTGAYAITKAGAAKMLWHTSRKLSLIDLDIDEATRNGFINTYSVVPSLMGQWKLNKALYSDKSAKNDSGTIYDKLATERLYDLADGHSPTSNSTRKNLEKLIRQIDL